MKVLVDLPDGFSYDYIKDGIRRAGWDISVPFIRMAYEALVNGKQLTDVGEGYFVHSPKAAIDAEFADRAEALAYAAEHADLSPSVTKKTWLERTELGSEAVAGKPEDESVFERVDNMDPSSGHQLLLKGTETSIWCLKSERLASVSAFLQVDDTYYGNEFRKIADEETKTGKPFYEGWYPSDKRFQSKRNGFRKFIFSYKPEEVSWEDMEKALEEAKEFVFREYPIYLESYIDWLENGFREYGLNRADDDIDAYIAELKLRLRILRNEARAKENA